MMKVGVLFLLLAIFGFKTTVKAQQIQTKAVFSYKSFQALDDKGNIIETLKAEGLICFMTTYNENYIAITGYDKTLYTFMVTNSKIENTASKKVKVYLGIQSFHGYKVPVQLFENYNLKKSIDVPESFVIFVMSAKTGLAVSGQVFLNVSRVR